MKKGRTNGNKIILLEKRNPPRSTLLTYATLIRTNEKYLNPPYGPYDPIWGARKKGEGGLIKNILIHHMDLLHPYGKIQQRLAGD